MVSFLFGMLLWWHELDLGSGFLIFFLCCMKMLAREIIEDSILPFLTREDPNLELAGEAISEKVN